MINQNDTYYQRMQSSIDDKTRLLSYIQKRSISAIDVGGADGGIAHRLEGMGMQNITIVDAAEEAINRVHVDDKISAIHAFADEINDKDIMGTVEPVDAIIASSVIHEIFSYGNRGAHQGKIKNVIDFFNASYDRLADNGVLLIRDGIRPNESDNATLSFDGASDYLKKFNTHSPFVNNNDNENYDCDRMINIVDNGDDLLSGSASSLFELLFTWNWGEESFEREVLEYYGIFSNEEMIEIASQVGFSLIHHESYIQQGYIDNWSKLKVDVGFPIPDTNAIWVFERCNNKQ